MIKVVDNSEALVDIKKYCPQLVVKWTRPTLSWEKSAYLRKTVADKLCRAQKLLPRGVTFVIGDAWRPRDIQKKLLDEVVGHLLKRHTSWSKHKAVQEAKKYVAPWKGKWASGHFTGGAVDLRLWKNNRKLAMNCRKLSFEGNNQSFHPDLPKYQRRNREIMFNTLEKVGLSNYSKEYWHWSYGDIQWAKRNGKKVAIYGAIKKPF
jgi:D-alanyl-D-alanine dipeptidase